MLFQQIISRNIIFISWGGLSKILTFSIRHFNNRYFTTAWFFFNLTRIRESTSTNQIGFYSKISQNYLCLLSKSKFYQFLSVHSLFIYHFSQQSKSMTRLVIFNHFKFHQLFLRYFISTFSRFLIWLKRQASHLINQLLFLQFQWYIVRQYLTLFDSFISSFYN